MLTLLKYFSVAGECRPTPGIGGDFFGIPTWYKYLPGEFDPFGKCIPVIELSNLNQAWFIGLAIIDILLRIITLIAVGFIIYGGFQYMTSMGEPDKTKSAKETILNALVGLAIALVASATVAFIGSRLT